jgi:hypothetical protein
MSHLGERVTALVDGQLANEAAERAARHLSECPECRQAVELERLMKYRLIGLGRPEPRADLVGSLLSLGGPSGPLPPRNGFVPGSPRPQLISIGLPPARSGLPVTGTGLRPPTRRDSMLRPMALPRALPRPALIPAARVARASRNRVAAAVVGAACLVGAGVAGGVAGGGVTASGQVIRGPIANQRAGRTTFDTFLVGRDDTGGDLPFPDQTVIWGRTAVPALSSSAHR